MKLIGSMTERDMQDRLIRSHNSLFQSQESRRLLSVIKDHFPFMRTAYILGWTPEQAEDLYTILINIDIIAYIELDRCNSHSEAIVEKDLVGDYMHGISKTDRIKLAVALDLAQKDIDKPDK